VLAFMLAVAFGCTAVHARSHPEVVTAAGDDDGSSASEIPTPAFAPAPLHAPQPEFSRAAYSGRPIKFVPNDHKEVAITFDDGPSANTTEVLSILSRYNAKATFFFVGKRAMLQDQRVLAVVAQGSEIGNHTWSHSELEHSTPATLAMQIDRAQAVLRLETSDTPVFVRPRSGKFDEAGRLAVAERGLVLALWSAHANDVEPSPPPKKLVKNATRHLRPGSIILMHETNANSIVALPAILERLRAKGLHAVTLSQLLADGRP
jgi:peptidoglycan/xylan/chitin deacetylase (PgdA/CDA1 family)